MQPQLETLPGGTKVYTRPPHAITTDSLLLARFCEVHARFSACDLGCGCGILLLSLVDKGLRGRAVGVEQNPEAAELLRRAATENGLENLAVVQGDLCAYQSEAPFDVVVANPPYFDPGSGKRPASADRAAARHEVLCTIFEVCATAARLLKDGGRLCLCWPPARAESLFAALYAARLAPKRMQLVRKTAADAPWLLLMDARKAGGEGLALLPDLLLPAGETVRY